MISGRIHVAPVFAPARIQDNIPGELFMYWFRARGQNPLPKAVFGPPHLWYVFPTPLCSRNVILLRVNSHRPCKSHFLRPPKLVLEGSLYGTFSPPQNRTIRFAPPLAAHQLFYKGPISPIISVFIRTRAGKEGGALTVRPNGITDREN